MLKDIIAKNFQMDEVQADGILQLLVLENRWDYKKFQQNANRIQGIDPQLIQTDIQLVAFLQSIARAYWGVPTLAVGKENQYLAILQSVGFPIDAENSLLSIDIEICMAITMIAAKIHFGFTSILNGISPAVPLTVAETAEIFAHCPAAESQSFCKRAKHNNNENQQPNPHSLFYPPLDMSDHNKINDDTLKRKKRE